MLLELTVWYQPVSDFSSLNCINYHVFLFENMDFGYVVCICQLWCPSLMDLGKIDFAGRIPRQKRILHRFSMDERKMNGQRSEMSKMSENVGNETEHKRTKVGKWRNISETIGITWKISENLGTYRKISDNIEKWTEMNGNHTTTNGERKRMDSDEFVSMCSQNQRNVGISNPADSQDRLLMQSVKFQTRRI